MKLIREARMGPPKSFKTGAVVGTYPTPMLYFGFDRGGLDVIPSRKSLETLPEGLIRSNVAYEDIEFVTPGKLASIDIANLKPVTALQYYEGIPLALTLDTRPTVAQMPFLNFVNDYNLLSGRTELPWKTVVIDSLTGFTDIILNWIAATNSKMFEDARQWASVAGGKVRQMVLSSTSLPCHVVCLLHMFIDKNEQTGEIRALPNLYSQSLRDDFFGMFSQCFYADQKMNGTPVLYVSNKYPVTGIGPRWPIGLPQEVRPDFQSIYGKELL
jgi:hypothetical protein